jgi:iron complex outermembrane recepter protein
MMPTKGLALADDPQKTRGNSLGRGDPYETTNHSPRVSSIISLSAEPSRMRVLRWIWGATVSFMILAPATFTTGRAWAELAQPPTDLADVIQTDTEFMMEELKFLQEETVSIAVAHEQPISEAPSNVYVITDEDIRQSGAIDIPTVLRRIPGMEILQDTSADFNVSARGNNQLRANKMLVLIDGRSIYLDVQGEVLWKAIPITLPEIKRIEVLKGPASAVYGFNAFDGVINIITKSGEEMNGSMVKFGGGEFDTFTVSAIQGGRFHKLDYRLSFGHDQNSQWDDRNALGFRSYKFNIQTKYELPDQATISFVGGYVNANRFDGPRVDTVQVQQDPSHGYVQIGYQKSNLILKAYWNRWDQSGPLNIDPRIAPFFTITDLLGSIQQTVEWDSYNFEGQHAWEIGTTGRITYGVNYRHNGASSSFLKQTTQEDRLGLYAQGEWRPIETLHVLGGFRWDLDTFINPTYSPRFSMVYKPAANHSVRFGVSVAYRPPTIFETRADSRGIISFPGVANPFPPPPFFVPPSTTTTVLEGSNNLNPERIITTEVGYQGWYFKHRLRLRLDLFYNHLSDLISRTTPIEGVATFQNDSGTVDIYGGEAGIELLLTPWLSGFANYAYQDIYQTATNPPLTGLTQRSGPRFKLNGGLRGIFDNGLNGEVGVHYVSAVIYPLDPAFAIFATFPGGNPSPNPWVGSYVLLNLRGGYRFWGDRAEVAVSAFNTLNDKHQEHPLGEIIRSRVMGWLTLRY